MYVQCAAISHSPQSSYILGTRIELSEQQQPSFPWSPHHNPPHVLINHKQNTYFNHHLTSKSPNTRCTVTTDPPKIITRSIDVHSLQPSSIIIFSLIEASSRRFTRFHNTKTPSPVFSTHDEIVYFFFFPFSFDDGKNPQVLGTGKPHPTSRRTVQIRSISSHIFKNEPEHDDGGLGIDSGSFSEKGVNRLKVEFLVTI